MGCTWGGAYYPRIYHLGYHMVVSLNYCSQNGGNLYRAPYYNGNPNIGPRIIGNLNQSPYACNVKLDRCAFNTTLEALGALLFLESAHDLTRGQLLHSEVDI